MEFTDWHKLYETLRELSQDISNNSNVSAATTKDGTPIRKLFIGNLAERTTNKDLQTLFSKFGQVESCYIKRNISKTNFAFLTFADVESGIKARKAAAAMQVVLHCRMLRVSAADSWHQPDSMENRKKFSPKPTPALLYVESEDRSLINVLNDDCLMEIFLHLPLADRVRMERVCKRWQAVIQESWRGVKRLDLSNATWGLSSRIRVQIIDTTTLRKILIRCGQFLTHLNLSHLPNLLSSSTLTIVGKLCPNLQHVNVSALELSPAGIHSLMTNCKNMNTFMMRTLTGSCEKELAALFEVNKKLRRLFIDGDQIITGRCLVSLPEDVEEIHLSRCSNIASIFLEAALAKFVKLKSFVLDSCVCVSNCSLKSIAQKVSLTHLDICGPMPMISADAMDVLCDLMNLQTLRLNRNSAVTDGFLMKISKSCRKLKLVNLSYCKYVTDRGIVSLASLPELQILKMCWLLNVTDKALRDLVGLRVLKCQRCVNIRDGGVIALVSNSASLSYLDLSGCSISNSSLEVAVTATRRRENNVILKMIVGGNDVNVAQLDISPLLQIVNVDLSNSGAWYDPTIERPPSIHFASSLIDLLI